MSGTRCPEKGTQIRGRLDGMVEKGGRRIDCSWSVWRRQKQGTREVLVRIDSGKRVRREVESYESRNVPVGEEQSGVQWWTLSEETGGIEFITGVVKIKTVS